VNFQVNELNLKRYISVHQVIFSSDIFQPVSDVIELSLSILEYLLSRGVGVAILTKGYIPERTLKLLLAHADYVRIQIGIITVDEGIRCVFEPNAASTSARLEQMARLVEGGIVTEARIIPIIPGITDKPGSIEKLLRAIANTGVKRAAISTLFLRPAIVASLKRRIADNKMLGELLAYYKSEGRLIVYAEHSSIIPLPLSKREEIYAHFRHVAEKYDINLSVCGCMNPDIGGRCNITGEWPEYSNQPSLL